MTPLLPSASISPLRSTTSSFLGRLEAEAEFGGAGFEVHTAAGLGEDVAGLIRNQQVIGSIPIVGSNGINGLTDTRSPTLGSREA
jgi:hypothetical protein